MDSPGGKRKYADVSSDDEADSPPRASFRGFKRAASRSESPPARSGMGMGLGMGRGRGRGLGLGQGWNNNGNKSPAGGGIAASSFGARMLAKMGHVQGQGLGSSGQGIVNPIEAQARPQGIGLGAVKEKSKEARAEEKRGAAIRGESVEESSDEEYKRRKRQQRKDKQRADGEGRPAAKKKPQFRTAREIEQDMAGLEVPNVLKSLIDATGKEQRILTSTAGLMQQVEFVNTEQSEAYKIARRARQDLEAFADEWKGLTERKHYIEQDEAQIVDQLDTNQRQIDQLSALVAAFGVLEVIAEEKSGSSQAKLDHVTDQLETLEIQYRSEIDEYRLWEAAVAAIHPLFREAMEDWEPLRNPTFLVSNLRRLQPLLSRKPSGGQPSQRQSTSPYETMIYTLWLPRVRSALLNDWDVFDPSPATTLIVAWKEILPSFVYANVLDQLVVPKLTNGLKSWKPKRSQSSSQSQQNSRVPWWLFTWLQHLDERHTNPKQATGLLSDSKRKFRTLLDTWDLNAGPARGFDIWRDALSSEFDTCLRNHLLPRLAAHLRNDFDVNPQDQDLTPFENILKWKDWLQPNVLGLLFVAEFFPKFHNILYIWLTNDPNYEEVAEWFTWWRSQFPSEINDLAIVDEEWNKALRTMDLAAQLGDRAASELPQPSGSASTSAAKTTSAQPSQPSQPSQKLPPAELPRKPKVIEEVAFKDILESWCAEEGLIMLPLREAHPQNGQPLFRITASAMGKGGVVAFIQGDVVWVQNKKAKEVWEPMGLEERLVERAEGK